MSEPQNRGVMIALAYLWPLAIIPLIADKQDTEVQWHARHGLVLMAAEILVFVAAVALAMIVSVRSVSLGCVFFLVLLFGWVAVIGVHVAAIVKGVHGQRLIVPFVSQYASRF